MKELKTYVQYLIGQKCRTKDGIGAIVESNYNSTDVLVSDGFKTDYYPITQVKPLLTRIGKMTEGHMRELFDSFMQDIYHYNPCDQFELVSDGNDAGLIANEPPSFAYATRWGLSINAGTGYVWLSRNGEDMMFNQFEATRKLCEWGYDVFQLIEADLAESLN